MNKFAIPLIAVALMAVSAGPVSANQRTGQVTQINAATSQIFVNGHRHTVLRNARGVPFSEIRAGDAVTITYSAKAQNQTVSRIIRAD